MSNPANSNFVLRVRLEPFDMEDPLGHFYEDPEIPNDVEQFVSTVPASAPVAPESTVVPASSSILEQSVPFVDSRVTDSDDFAKPKQFADEDETSKFYDNYNVEDRDPASPNGRIAWQKKLLDLILRGSNTLATTRNQLPKNIGASEKDWRNEDS